MKCIAQKEIKDCVNQETCCNDCNYEDCHEGRLVFEVLLDGCEGCYYAREEGKNE